jgi:hypothetical protein
MSNCCFKGSCPSPISTINVVVNNLSLSDGNTDVFRQEELTLTSLGGLLWSAVLTQLPYSDASLHIFLNGVLLLPGRDYVRSVKRITFTFTEPYENDGTIVAHYFGTDYATIDSMIQPGMMIPAAVASSYNFVGFLLCDGASYLRSAKPALFAAIGTTYGLGSDDPNTFNVPDIENSYVDAASDFTIGPIWIKE